MKKILFVALAAVGLAACVQNEELAVSQDGKAITFDNAYVENATKAAIDGSYTAAKGNLDHFNVWATIGNNGSATNIFKELLVEKTNGAWTYDASYTQYWIPGNHYEFVGVVDGVVSVTDDACTMPVTIATSLSEQKDVLYATESRTYNGGEVQPVHLQFEHLLAKAKFTVNNTISAELSGLEYVVESITILNADDQALYTIENGTWEALTQYSEPLDFGVVTKNSAETGAVADRIGYNGSAESNWERLILPREGKSFSIKVDYKLYKDDVVVYTNIGKENNVMTSGPVDIAAGKAYNFVLTLGNPGEPIVFKAGVVDWIPENAPVYYDVVEVATAEQFETAFATSDVNTIVLGEDVVLGASATRAESDPKLTINNGKSLTIDLNGHKLSATSSLSTSNRELFLVKGDLTIKNGTIEYQHVGDNMGWNAMTTIFDVTAGGVLNLEGVTAKNLGGSDMGFVAHLNNWGEVTLNVDNCTLQSNYVAVRVFNSGPNKNNVDIKNSILKGGSTALWVHNYTAEDFGSESKAAAQQALLNLNYLDQGNTFRPHANSVRYGFTNSIRFNLEGITKSVSEDGTEVTLGSLVEDGVVGRYVAGDEENSTIKKVVVSEGIATLYDRTFRRFYALEEVVLPSTLTTIGAEGTGVFQTCTSLKSIVLPENLTVLGNGTFYGCSSLESVNIPAGVTRIEENCLRETALEEIVFHEGVTYFGAQAFRDCKKLKKVVINAPEFTVAANAFGVMAGTLPGTTIYVANEEMKAYLESTLAYKNQFTIVGPQPVSTTEELAAAIKAGGNYVLANDIAVTERLVMKDTPNFTLDGKGYTISQNFNNEFAIFDDIHATTATFKNIVFDGLNGGAAMRSIGGTKTVVNIDNITVQNCNHTQVQGLLRLTGKSTIKNSTFKNNTCSMVVSLNYDGANSDPQVVENCVFENNTCSATAVVYYVKGAGATINGNKFVGNTVSVTGANNAATLYMGFTENNVITNNLFENNTVNAGTSKRVSGGLMIGHAATITGNAFVGNTVNAANANLGNDVCASVYYAAIDLSGNYWGGNAPVEGDDYYKEYSNYELIINDYLTTNPLQ